MEGGDLCDRILRSPSDFTERDAGRSLVHLLQGLESPRRAHTAAPIYENFVRYLHEHKCVHRNVRPEKLLYTSTKPTAKAKLTDLTHIWQRSPPACPAELERYSPCSTFLNLRRVLAQVRGRRRAHKRR